MNKRGISPLIAMVLIIGFTVVLTVVVVNWARSITGDLTGQVGCETAATSLCRNMPDIPISVSEAVIPPTLMKVTMSNVYSKNLEFLLTVRDPQGAILDSTLKEVSGNSIDYHLFSSGTYVSGNSLEYSIILKHTEEETECKITCNEGELTVA